LLPRLAERLAALAVAGIPFITQMGVAAAFTVVVAVVIALTLLPALLGFAGRRILGRPPRAQHVRRTEGEGAGRQRAGAIARRPVLALLIGVVTLGVIAIPRSTCASACPTTAPPRRTPPSARRTTLVRMTIVPADMTLLGRSAWWLPRWLDRVLPDVDVEGERLRHQLDDTPAAPAPALN
jgi:uncharacterized membrane protein YdfJ with MMPL/SSD domain